MGSLVTKKQTIFQKMGVNIASKIVEMIGAILLRLPSWGALKVTFPNGKSKVLGNPQSENMAHLVLNNFKLFSKIRRGGTVGFARSYMDKDIDSDDLTKLFSFFIKNRELFDKAGKGIVKRAFEDLAFHKARKNTREGAKKNIAYHYDLGNDFYSLWLDPSMTYSSAYFSTDKQTLEEAQIAKYHKVANMAGIKEGDSVFEIGCGWGGFAQTIAQDYGALIYGISLSNEQLKYAKERIKRAGLGNLVSLNFEDYRDSIGQYDHVCSIEMIEAVGEEHWGQYFKAIYDRLKINGTAAIQAITINEKDFEHYRKHPDFIQRYIFPGGMLLTKQAMYEEGKKVGLKLEKNECFAHSYAKTLAIWRDNFIEQWPKIKKLGFDERFKRKWIYYLSYCEAGFNEGVIDVGIYQYRKLD